MKKSKLWLSLLMIGCMATFVSCGDDEDEAVAALEITSISATGTGLETGEQTEADLNAATAAENVPLDPTIQVVFSREIDASTANASNFTLSPSGDGGTAVPLDVSGSGSTVTLTPQEDLQRGTAYTLTILGSLRAEDGGTFSTVSRTFTTAGRAEVAPPQAESQLAYWAFDGNANDAVGEFNADAEVEVEYVEDRFGQMGSAVSFDGDRSIIEVPNGDQLITDNWTLSFWAQIDTTNHDAGHFILGVGAFHGFQFEAPKNASFVKLAGRYKMADGNTQSNDFFVNGDGQDAANGGWVGVEVEEDVPGGLESLLADEWAHIVVTYNSTDNTRSLYINGDLIQRDNLSNADLNYTGLTFDASGTADEIGTKLAFGFPFDRTTTLWQNEPWGNYDNPEANHFKGELDDVRIFSVALSDSEVQNLYELEN